METEGLQFQELLSCGTELIGFVDGSWKRRQDNIHAGIGGVIFKDSGEAIFSFFGPSKAESSQETEWEAFSFLVSNFVGSEWSKHHITIFTDCSNIYCKYLELSSTSQALKLNEQNIFLRLLNLKVKCIPSELNAKADCLAKKGAFSKKSNHFWVLRERQ